MEGLTDIKERCVSTPFGDPSDALIIGTLSGVRVAFLPRHGRGHRLTPSEVPYQANIYALKSLGVEHIISVSACGSLREHLHPGEVVIPHQLVDLTKRREMTFSAGAYLGVADFALVCLPAADATCWRYGPPRTPCHHRGRA
jgi:5'-methylthioadenosine phosphorylase